MKDLIVLGAGQFAHVVARAADTQGWNVVGFVVDDRFGKAGHHHVGLPVWSASAFLEWDDLGRHAVVSGIVSPERAGLVAVLDGACDSMAVVSRYAFVNDGCVVRPGAFVNVGAVLDLGVLVGKHAIINRGALVGHHVRVGSCASIGPGANLCGNVEVGSGAFVGAGAVVRETVNIGEAATVGMGSVVVKDVPAGETWWGIPARRAR